MAAFAAAHGFEAQLVRDCLRGVSSTAKPAVAELLGVEPDQLVISRDATVVEGDSNVGDPAHRLFATAR